MSWTIVPPQPASHRNVMKDLTTLRAAWAASITLVEERVFRQVLTRGFDNPIAKIRLFLKTKEEIQKKICRFCIFFDKYSVQSGRYRLKRAIYRHYMTCNRPLHAASRRAKLSLSGLYGFMIQAQHVREGGNAQARRLPPAAPAQQAVEDGQDSFHPPQKINTH